jgi:FKBP-type peptidyl-prolyl cis-trans isomerase SlyD
MPDTHLVVADNLVVSMDYTARLDDGQVADTSSDKDPLEFIQGQGQIVPGLENALYGMAVDEEKEVLIAPADAYGDVNESEFQLVPRDVFPPTVDLTPGQGLHLRDNSTQQVMQAYVVEVRSDDVLLDFNHRLAGETLRFSVKIVGLRQATSEELSHGHVHDGEHDD